MASATSSSKRPPFTIRPAYSDLRNQLGEPRHNEYRAGTVGVIPRRQHVASVELGGRSFYGWLLAWSESAGLGTQGSDMPMNLIEEIGVPLHLLGEGGVFAQ